VKLNVSQISNKIASSRFTRNNFFPRRKVANLAILAATIGLVGSFFLVVPIGTGPDSGAHSVLTYCANGTKNGVCEFQDLQEDIVYRKVKIASGLSGIGICHGNNLEKNASCDEPWRSKGLTSFYLDSKMYSGDSSTLLYAEFMGKKRFKIYLDRSKEDLLRLTVNDKKVTTFNIKETTQISNCEWPCTISINDPEYLDQRPIISIIPNTTTRTFMVMFNKQLVIEYNDFSNPPALNSLSNKWIDESLVTASEEAIIQRFDLIEKTSEIAYFTDNYNPPFIYKLLNIFKADSPRSSLHNFRIVSFVLIALGLALTFVLFFNSIYFARFMLGFLLSSSIYGFYLFATNNTSSYAFLGCLMISSIPLLLFEFQLKYSRIILLIYSAFAILLSTGRVDGLFFSLIGFCLVSLLKPPQPRERLLSVTIFIALLTSFWYVYETFPAAKSIHMTRGLTESVQNISLNNIFEIPGLMLGLQGDRGPLNIWGLGQLDVPLPSIIPFGVGLSVSIFFTIALFGARYKSTLILTAAFLLWFLPFALTLASYHTAPGGWMFARYGLSQYGILVLIVVILALPNNAFSDKNLRNLSKPFVFGMLSVMFSILLTFFVLAEKYMNGILLDRKDSFLPAIRYLGEWVPTVAVHYREIDLSNGWQPYIIQNPYYLLTIVSGLMVLVTASLFISIKLEEEKLD
jgi:hypothetical protein